jgi:hypothetical protein
MFEVLNVRWYWVVVGLGLVSLFTYQYLSTRRYLAKRRAWLKSIEELIVPAEYVSVRLPEGSERLFGRDELRTLQSSLQEETERLEGAYAKRLGLLMPVLVSILVLGSAMYVILSGAYSSEQEKWAFGSIGTILGYWLKVG